MYIGIDLLSFRITGTAFTDIQEPERLHSEIIPIKRERERTFEADLAAIHKLVRLLEAEHGQAKAVGLSLPAEVGAGTATIIEAGELVHWKGLPLARIAKSINRRVEIGGYLEANALAELYYGAVARTDFQYVCWGRKVQAVRVQEGVVVPLNLGHTRLKGTSPHPCSMRHNSCLEAFAGATSLLQRYGVDAIRSLPLEAWEFSGQYFAQVLEKTAGAAPDWVFGGGMTSELPGFCNMLSASLKSAPKEIILSTASEVQSAGTLGALALLRRKRQ